MSRRQSMHRQLVIKEGFLSRAPAGKLASLKTWERCWYVFGLQGLHPYLECYADPQAVLTGLSVERIELGSCQKIVTKMITVDSRHPHSFNLILSDRVLCLAADTRSELSAWCRALQKKLEELGVLTPEHENLYEMLQPLSRLRQVSLQEQAGSDLPSVAVTTTVSAAAQAVRRPRAATPLSNASSDSGAPEATPQPAARPNGVRMENDFAPPRRRAVVDSEEARRNVGRLLAVCTAQDGYYAGGCSCGSSNGSCDCGRPSAVSNGQADAATLVAESSSSVVPTAVPSASSVMAVSTTAAAPPPAAAPRRSGSVAQAVHSAAAVVDVTRRTAASTADVLPLGTTPEVSFRPIDAAPAPTDRGSSHAAALPPVARPIAVSGAAGVVLPVAGRASTVTAADHFELRDLQPRQPQMQPERPPQPMDRASLDHAPSRVPERSESDYAVHRVPPVTHAAAATPDNWDRTSPLAATRLSLQQPQLPPRPATTAVPLEQRQQQPHVTACRAAAALPSDRTVRPNADGSDAIPTVVMRRQRQAANDDDANDAAGAYSMVVGRTLVATEEPDDDGNPLYSVATNKMCLFGLDLEGGTATAENDYELPLDAVVAEHGLASRFSQVAAASSRCAAPAHVTSTAAPDNHPSAASRVTAVSRSQESSSELLSSDRQRAAVELSNKGVLCSDVTGRVLQQQQLQIVGKSEATTSCRVQDGDDDDSADFYDVGVLSPLASVPSSVAVTSHGPDAGANGRDGTHVPHTGRLAHGLSSYSEAVSADSPVEDLLPVTSECPPLPAKLAGRTSVGKSQHETTHSDRHVIVSGSAAKPVAATACKTINSSGLAAESSEYQDWPLPTRHGTAEAKPPLPQRLHGSSTGKSTQAVQQWLQATSAAASAPGCGSNSSSSDSDDNPAEPAPARPPRVVPRTGGTLVLGGSMLKMPKPRPLGGARDGEGFGQQPIRQSQVEDLLREVNNAGGVKVNAYKKEVSGNICFVDVDNRVWIAGWNQKSQPLLQKLLHVGDEVLSLNHEAVTSSSMLYKSIRMGDNDRKLSFVLRRLPYATVLSIRRGYDGEDVGIRCLTGTPEVDVVVPGGLAHSSGLKPRASAPDSKRQCNWFLTEINNRPMSLFTKNGEVDPRLSAVGKDVMLVLQPVDFITKLKKQLKGHWGYKNYVVQ